MAHEELPVAPLAPPTEAPPAPVKRSKYEKKKARQQRRKNEQAAARAALAAASLSSAKIAPSPPHCCPPWLSPADLARSNDPALPITDRLGTELAQYAAYTQRVVTAARGPIDAAIDHIARCVTAIWPQATVTRFGSFATGLWLPSSDVDVVVLGVLDVVDSADAIADGVAALEAIARGLRGQRDWVKRIDVVRGAKVPVAKLELQARGLHVDISIENGHTHRGIEASTLVRRYVRELPLLRPLVLALKQFLREKALNDAFTGGLSSYAVTLLAVFLLEHEPTDAMDQPVKDEDAKGSGTELGRALLDFLEFYGLGFCYATTGISLRPEAFGEYLLAPLMAGLPMMPQLVIDDPVYSNGQHNAAAGAFAIARVIAALENAHYALRFHRPTRFTPSPLCQLLHWSGHDTPGGGSAKPQL